MRSLVSNKTFCHIFYAFDSLAITANEDSSAAASPEYLKLLKVEPIISYALNAQL